MTTKLRETLRSLGVKITSVESAPREGFGPGSSHWRCILSRSRTRHSKLEHPRTLSTHYSMGAAHTGNPKVDDVVYCLMSDADSVRYCESFEEWCGELGMNADSRKDFAVYQACLETCNELDQFFLVKELEEIREACQDF